jgi:adenosylcobinamide-GDP ribazoletransferase
MRTLLIAVQFLTRVPVRLGVAPGDEETARAAGWFPLVGAAVGGVAALGHLVAVRAHVPALAPYLALGVAVALTGALHEDGLADTCDGLFGGATRERRLEIMRDSRVGTYGVVGLVLVLGAQVAAVGALPAALAARALVAAHAAGRAAALALTRLPYARASSGGLGRPLAGRVPPLVLGAALATGGAALCLLPLPLAAACAGCASVIVALAGWRFARDLGGVTGDALGAVTKLVEVACYVATAAYAARSAAP